jgi:hypothetical protein
MENPKAPAEDGLKLIEKQTLDEKIAEDRLSKGIPVIGTALAHDIENRKRGREEQLAADSIKYAELKAKLEVATIQLDDWENQCQHLEAELEASIPSKEQIAEIVCDEMADNCNNCVGCEQHCLRRDKAAERIIALFAENKTLKGQAK